MIAPRQAKTDLRRCERRQMAMFGRVKGVDLASDAWVEGYRRELVDYCYFERQVLIIHLM